MRDPHWPVATDCRLRTYPIQPQSKAGRLGDGGDKQCKGYIYRQRNCLSASWGPTPLRLCLQGNPHRSIEVGGDGGEVGNVCPANRRTAPA